MRVDAETQLSSSFIVDYASAADKKAKPVRWLIVVMTCVVAVVSAFLGHARLGHVATRPERLLNEP